MSDQGTTRVDKTGNSFAVGLCGTENRAALVEMYDTFSPMAASQGLPPADATARHNWVDSLFKGAENFVAWKEDKIIGHCALLPDLDKGDGEYIIFVNQNARRKGVGTELTAMALQRARELGLNNIWLTVESYNFRAIKLYRKVGFQFCDQCDQERTMILEL